ncbi:MAG: hypothetical protein U9Q72_02700 [Patescibacteria group bacterium]|nr:hypothetical protein [Patescibacteria group bacterium]
MNQLNKVKLIIFFSLLGGAIFLIIALIGFPKYQSSFSAVILEKKPNSSNITVRRNQEKIVYALNFTKHFLLSDFFIEQVEKRIDADLDNLSAQGEFSAIKEFKNSNKKKWKIDRKSWGQSIVTKNSTATNLIFVKLTASNPSLVYLYSLETAQNLKETLPEFINAEELEIKILNGPTKATTNYPDFIYFSILGLIMGGLAGTTWLIFLKKKTIPWIHKKPNLKWGRKIAKNKKKKTEVEFIAYPQKDTPVQKDSKDENLSDKKIKERLNRLINGEF